MRFCILFGLFFSFGIVSCNEKAVIIRIAVENNSDIQASVTLSVFLDDTLYTTLPVPRDSVMDRFSIIKLPIHVRKDRYVIRFLINETKDSSGCVLYGDSIQKSTIVHVNYSYQFGRDVIHDVSGAVRIDTTIRKAFYCDVMYRGFPTGQ